MATALWIFLTALALLVSAAAAVLATPIRLGFTVRTKPQWQLRVAARLLGGLTPAIPIHDSSRRAVKVKRRPGRRTGAKGKRQARTRRPKAARVVRAVRATPRLLGDLLRPIHLTRLAVDADVGLADPADTGQLFGLFTALRYARPSGSTISVDVRPDFTGPRASGRLDAELSFIPVAFVPPGVRFAWRVFGPHR